MSDNGSKKRKLHKIIIKHPSIPFRICPSIPVLIELDTVEDLIPDYEVKIKLEYKEENISHTESTVEESAINAIFREEMKKQNDLDDLITSKRRRGSLIGKGDDSEEDYFLNEEESPNETVSQGDI